MSEEDYQRGLRGGGCPVSISDWERYSDWKAGSDEHDRRIQQEVNNVLREGEDDRAARATRKFECPFCLEPALRDSASRCSLCRSDIPSDYWPAARSKRKEENEAQRQAEIVAEAKYEREDAARWRKIEDRLQEEKRAEAVRSRRENAQVLMGASFFYAVAGYLVGGVGGCANRVRLVFDTQAEYSLSYLLGAFKTTGLVWALAVWVLLFGAGVVKYARADHV
jgi:hypothetical protein